VRYRGSIILFLRRLDQFHNLWKFEIVISHNEYIVVILRSLSNWQIFQLMVPKILKVATSLWIWTFVKKNWHKPRYKGLCTFRVKGYIYRVSSNFDKATFNPLPCPITHFNCISVHLFQVSEAVDEDELEAALNSNSWWRGVDGLARPPTVETKRAWVQQAIDYEVIVKPAAMLQDLKASLKTYKVRTNAKKCPCY